jgi:hypothetical protein
MVRFWMIDSGSIQKFYGASRVSRFIGLVRLESLPFLTEFSLKLKLGFWKLANWYASLRLHFMAGSEA